MPICRHQASPRLAVAKRRCLLVVPWQARDLWQVARRSISDTAASGTQPEAFHKRPHLKLSQHKGYAALCYNRAIRRGSHHHGTGD
jgi:hypothetical protein